MPTVLLVGASGIMGGLIAQEAARRDLNLVLAGRHQDCLGDLAGTFGRGQPRALLVDVAASEALDAVVSGTDLVLNTVGPFTRLAAPLIEACLRAGVPYVDLANELEAVLALLGRDAEARRQSVTLVTGAGFGVTATEALLLRRRRQLVELKWRHIREQRITPGDDHPRLIARWHVMWSVASPGVGVNVSACWSA